MKLTLIETHPAPPSASEPTGFCPCCRQERKKSVMVDRPGRKRICQLCIDRAQRSAVRSRRREAEKKPPVGALTLARHDEQLIQQQSPGSGGFSRWLSGD